MIFNQLQSAIRQSGGASDLKFSPVCLTSNWSSFLIGFFEEFRCHLSIALFANLEFSFKPQSGPKVRNICFFLLSFPQNERKIYYVFFFIFIIQKLKSKHTSLKKYTNWAKLIYFSLVLREREEKKNQIFRTKDVRRHQCHICDATFVEYRNLKNHIAFVHERDKQILHKCDVCKNDFLSRSDLKRHVLRVHEKEKPWKCGVCDKDFADKPSLVRHKSRVHDGIRPFSCSSCQSSFFNQSSLLRHFEAVHEGKKPFQCEICQQKYTTKISVLQHTATVHGGDTPFKCSICDAGFNIQHNLTRLVWPHF